MLTIGIINNMAPAAIAGTERLFCDLLSEAARDDISFTVRWFRLIGARPANYGQTPDLKKHGFDGLIITGCEPRAAALRDEAVWEPLTKTIDWAARATTSVIFSCLSAHAAVLHLDGVQRHMQPEKIFGLFPAIKSTNTADHPMQAAYVTPGWRRTRVIMTFGATSLRRMVIRSWCPHEMRALTPLRNG